MNINKDTLEKIAHLARLKFDDSTAHKMQEDMNNILSFVDKLQEVDTEGVKPLESMSQEINNLRLDEAKKNINVENAFKNAPRSENGHFLVPKVIE